MGIPEDQLMPRGATSDKLTAKLRDVNRISIQTAGHPSEEDRFFLKQIFHFEDLQSGIRALGRITTRWNGPGIRRQKQ